MALIKKFIRRSYRWKEANSYLTTSLLRVSDGVSEEILVSHTGTDARESGQRNGGLRDCQVCT